MRLLVTMCGAAAALISLGCQSSGTSLHAQDGSAAATAETAERAVQQAKFADATPIAADSAVLTVGGLGCPLCATNIENKLGGLQGVSAVSVDLQKGLVKVDLWGKDRPSPKILAKAVKDSGFTPTHIQIAESN